MTQELTDFPGSVELVSTRLIGQSDEIGDLVTALVEASKSFTPATKDSRGNYGSYTTLAAVLDAVNDGLHENGLVVSQQTDCQDGSVVLMTRVIHTSGQWLASYYPVEPQRKDPQGYGSALTYARRYSLMALLSIAPEDDDGQAASSGPDGNSGRDEREAQVSRTQQRPETPPADAEKTALNNAVKAASKVLGRTKNEQIFQHWTDKMGGKIQDATLDALKHYAKLLKEEIDAQAAAKTAGPAHSEQIADKLQSAAAENKAAEVDPDEAAAMEQLGESLGAEPVE